MTPEQRASDKSQSRKKRVVIPLTMDRLRELLRYDPQTGLFICLISRHRARAGTVTGTENAVGYIQIGVDWKVYLAHRLAWFYMTGEWPDPECDHKNLDRTDNRWSNLREATRTQNGVNKPRQSNNTSGFKGVSRAGTKWRAYIVVKRKQIHLGCCASPEEAHALYVEAAKTYYGEFARAA